MKMFLCLGLLISLSNFGNSQNRLPNNLPLHFTSYKDWTLVEKGQHAFYFQNRDTLIEHEMHLLNDKEGVPIMFYADIKTPVCINGLCKPLYIEMYWNLVGEYIGYGVYPQEVLTKFDHDIFEEQDYLKLHELLLDDNSVLGRRRLSDLYDNKKVRERAVKFKGVEVDAISGATIKAIKSSVVDGALYSCYTLYHLVHGKTPERIREFLPGIYSDLLVQRLISSENKAYNYYALRQFSNDDFQEYIDVLIPVFINANPLVRAYMLKKIPKNLYKHNSVVEGLYKSFSTMDNNSKTLLIKYLPYSNPNSVLYLSDQLKYMSKNQLKNYLTVINSMEGIDWSRLKKKLQLFSENAGQQHNYLVKEYLEKGINN